MQALLLYHTKTGHTLEAAEAIIKGLTASNRKVKLMLAKDFKPEDAAKCDMLIVGSPCWGGSMGAGVSTPIVKALNALTNEVDKKPCAGFSVNGKLGGKNTVTAIGAILVKKGCSQYINGPIAQAGVPFSLWKGPAVTAKALATYEDFGKQLAKLKS